MRKNSNNETKNFDPKKSRIWFVLNIFFTSIYLIWRFFFTIPLEYGMVSIIAGISLLLVEFLGMLEALVHYYNMYKVENYPLPEVPKERFPDVDIYIATYNESCDVLYKTVNGCLYMDYPDKKKVHIYLCDDGRRPEVRALAAKMGVGYLDREDNKHAKAGNLNNALAKTSSPLVVTFDADMIPRHEFLMHTIPYFVQREIENEQLEEEDRKYLGFVQTPQVFYNPDLFQFNLFSENRIPNEQDYFYRDIQVSRNKSNSVIYGGSNTVLSRAALMDIGGFFTGSITEDYGTGILLQKKGYICIAINEPLASGLSPTDLKSLVNQRRRWARGVITTNRKMHIWLTSKLKLSQKINYWASCWYWYAPLKRLIYFMSPILYGVFGYVVIKCNLWQILLFWLPMYITSNISLKMLSRNIRTTKWTSIYETVMFPYLLIPVILETFGVTMKTFKVTDKGQAENERGKNMPYLIPFLLLVILSVIGIINCLRIMLMSGSMGPIVVLFWLIVNLFTLVMAMFFVLGRNLLRKNERAFVSEECQIDTGSDIHEAITSDISENGIAVWMDRPISILEDEKIGIRIWNDRYESKVWGRIVHVDKRERMWKYAFVIMDKGDTYEQYLQILYDRIPTLPQNLDSSSGGFDDLRINLWRRREKLLYQKRKLPRIDMQVDLPDELGRRWHIRDFNYQHLSIISAGCPETLTLIVDKQRELKLRCIFERMLNPETGLYKVDNFKELYNNRTANKYLQDWVFRITGCEMAMEKEEVITEAEMTEAAEKAADVYMKKEFDERDYL